MPRRLNNRKEAETARLRDRWESSYRFFRLTPMTADQGMSLVWLSSSTCNPYSCTVSLPVLKVMVPCARSMPTSAYSSSVALPGWVLTRTVIGLTSCSDMSYQLVGCRVVGTLVRIRSGERSSLGQEAPTVAPAPSEQISQPAW